MGFKNIMNNLKGAALLLGIVVAVESCVENDLLPHRTLLSSIRSPLMYPQFGSIHLLHQIRSACW
jgi:ABC-type anion transport system duplicated permease subunit